VIPLQEDNGHDPHSAPQTKQTAPHVHFDGEPQPVASTPLPAPIATPAAALALAPTSMSQNIVTNYNSVGKPVLVFVFETCSFSARATF
jgi:hypothetical protein